jgi:hypothetical protein
MCVPDLKKNLKFLDILYFNSPIPNFMENRPVGAELFHEDRWTESGTDGQAGLTKPISAFSDYASAANKAKIILK